MHRTIHTLSEAFLRAAIAVAVLSVLAISQAATLTWDADPGPGGAQDGSGVWNTTNNNWWDGSTNVSWNNAALDSAVFGSGGAAEYTVTLGEGVVTDHVVFSSGPHYTLAGDTLTLQGTARRLTVHGQTTFHCPMTVVGASWNKYGAGTLILNAASPENTIYVNHTAGVMRLRDNQAAGSGYIHAFDNTSVEVENGIRVANSLYIGNTSTSSTVVSLRSNSGDNEWAGTVYIHDTHEHAIIGVDIGSTLTISGRIRRRNQAVGTLTKVGLGALTLSGNNDHLAPVHLNEGVTIIRHSYALGTADAGTTVASGAALQIENNIAVGGETLTLSGTGMGGTGALRSTSGMNSWAGPITSSGTVSVGVDSGALTLGGAIAGTALTKVGGGNLVLSAENTYTGRTTIEAGTLQLAGGDNRINPSSSFWAEPFSTLDLNGCSQAFQSHSRLRQSTLLLGSGTLTLYSADLWGSSTISGEGQIVKEGTGTVTFGSVATHTGGTVINNGRIAMYSGGNRLPVAGHVQVNGAGILDLAYYAQPQYTQTIGTLSGDGTVYISGTTFIVGNGNGSSEFSGSIVDGLVEDTQGRAFLVGQMHKTGTGTITLSGDNTYKGPTSVNQGVLEITHAKGLGATDAGTTVASGAALELAGNIAVGEEPLALEGTGIASTGALRSTSGMNSWAGPITLAAGSQIGVDTGSILTIDGSMTAAAQYVKVGGGTLILTNANTQSQQTDISGGVLVLQHSQAISGATYAHVSSSAEMILEGGISVSGSGLYIGNTNSTATKVNFRSANGNNAWNGFVRLHQTHPYAVIAVDAGSTLTINGVIEPHNSSVGSLTKTGEGTMLLTAANTYTGPTTVGQGTLAVNGSIATSSGISVNAGAKLQGHGRVPAISGGGLVSPGNSAGILTAPDVDPGEGLGFAFELGRIGSPDYATASDTGNDVLRLTDAATPFIANLGTGNSVDIYLGVTDLTWGMTFRGGFYTDRDEDFLDAIGGTAFNYYVLGDGNGAYGFNGQSYYALAESWPTWHVELATVPEFAAFAGGSASGYVMQLTAVPEPGSLFLLAVGLACTLLLRRR
ncbi:MAG: autotransporter-associated beta strand repeat-containing protein [Thermoguttaceae bacterium]|jgi:autotransporter-associated beta strand protein|nr:autotransporter-associated beta strand repeat-containing protein [Thermoguttaceae bacterium]